MKDLHSIIAEKMSDYPLYSQWRGYGDDPTFHMLISWKGWLGHLFIAEYDPKTKIAFGFRMADYKMLSYYSIADREVSNVIFKIGYISEEIQVNILRILGSIFIPNESFPWENAMEFEVDKFFQSIRYSELIEAIRQE